MSPDLNADGQIEPESPVGPELHLDPELPMSPVRDWLVMLTSVLLVAAGAFACVAVARGDHPPEGKPLPLGGETPPHVTVQRAKQLPDGSFVAVDVDLTVDSFTDARLLPFYRWQPLVACYQQMASEHECWCRRVVPFYADRPSAAAYAEAAAWTHIAWNYLSVAMDRTWDDDTREDALDLLAELLGEDAFTAGWMPPPWPCWAGWPKPRP